MRTAHQRSWQTCGIAWLAALAASCSSATEQGTIWPPPDFSLTVDEVSLGDDSIRTLCRFRARADGVVIYGTSTAVVVDAVTGSALPVFARLSVYELVPTCTRALARRVYLAGLRREELPSEHGQREGDVRVGTVVRWRAFGNEETLSSRGRVQGEMADILAIVGSHLPEGEAFASPGVAERGFAPVLRGAPAPRDDAAGALAAYLELLGPEAGDPSLLLDAFALACQLERRDAAVELLDRWRAATSDAASDAAEAGAGETLTAEILTRMLPVAGS